MKKAAKPQPQPQRPPITRQREWQLRQREAGRCTICGKRAQEGSGRCRYHLEKQREYSAAYRRRIAS